MKTPKLTKHTRASIVNYSTYALFIETFLALCYFYGVVNDSDFGYFLPILPTPFSNILCSYFGKEKLSGRNKTWYWVHVIAVVLLVKGVLMNQDLSSFVAFSFSLAFLGVEWKILSLL